MFQIKDVTLQRQTFKKQNINTQNLLPIEETLR